MKVSDTRLEYTRKSEWKISLALLGKAGRHIHDKSKYFELVQGFILGSK